MKEWLQMQVSSNQDFLNQMIGFVIVGYLGLMALFLLWIVVFGAPLLILSGYQRLFKLIAKEENPSMLLKVKTLNYRLEEIRDSFNPLKRISDYSQGLSPTAQLKHRLIFHIVFMSLWFVGAFMIVFTVLDNPYREYQLITKGLIAKGFITEAKERESGSNDAAYSITYNFETQSKNIITSRRKFDGELPEELIEIAQPVPIKIVYLIDNPGANVPKQNLHGISSFWRGIGFGSLFFVLLSFPAAFAIRIKMQAYTKEVNRYQFLNTLYSTTLFKKNDSPSMLIAKERLVVAKRAMKKYPEEDK